MLEEFGNIGSERDWSGV